MVDVTEATLSIGEVAKRAAVSASAIRYYERQGLLPEPERTGGQRRYAAGAIRRLEVIAAAKRGGLTLDEIGVLLKSDEEGGVGFERLRALAAAKLPEAEAQIERARAKRDWLAAASGCGCKTLEACALFAAEPGPGMALS
jgi:MerR family transcriptional regulator, redox-sensitive transcriptional activator SoxR